ncbi:hypothetical protein VOLCADRAFT_99162 [Volvox carteri f. nagariensis]|uniref:Uncharacterized protein n=1 Tax=Volvox carteri f. nagariensis TaxID=3068 RepID=D8UH53_VOLCA|nr:uncharacterized protein VOLCADRAFT_99162 [Volvox carteri f. nagariensis]EFJ40917.1 hypothetical protein VOLCADRAFT_99162 [Volvox carteri f. nagariensis]|eukprot:XP_002957984.1 hypothetical protein VOLCADRAFT_99162 [Volvox carteri f. nagariensis]
MITCYEQLRAPSWEDLSAGLFERIASFLEPNEVACSVRIINKDTAQLFRTSREVRLSQPVPHHAFLWRFGNPEAWRPFTLQKRLELLCLVAHSGSLANLQVAVATAGCSLMPEAFRAAAAGGHVNVCEWLIAENCPMDLGAVKVASSAGHYGVVRLLLPHQQLVTSTDVSCDAAWTAAAGAGQRALCERLLDDGIPPGKEALFAAARGGHVDLTEWMLQLPQLPALDDGDKALLLRRAAYGFDLVSLQRLFSCQQVHNSRMNLVERNAAAAAALAAPTRDWRDKVQWLAGGEMMSLDGFSFPDMCEFLRRPDCHHRLQLVDWAFSKRFYHDTFYTGFAVQAANMPLLQYLRGRGMSLASRDLDVAASQAAEHGDVEFLNQVLALGHTLHVELVKAAARGGHLHVLQWMAGPQGERYGGLQALRQALASPDLAEVAASSGSVEVMAWLRCRGCPWNKWVFVAGAGAGSLRLLQWLAAWGCPMGSLGEPYTKAGSNGDFASLRCLRRLGCPWGPDGWTFSQAVYDAHCVSDRPCSLAVLKWLLAEGCPVDWRAAKDRVADRFRARRDAESQHILAWIESQEAEKGEEEEKEAAGRSEGGQQ